ncbi:MAG: hypothetical protein JRM78_02315 [Nitrososphaerota archaeon]|nr:hypothetical protein [Nitrososphaerota archaeon]
MEVDREGLVSVLDYFKQKTEIFYLEYDFKFALIWKILEKYRGTGS